MCAECAWSKHLRSLSLPLSFSFSLSFHPFLSFSSSSLSLHLDYHCCSLRIVTPDPGYQPVRLSIGEDSCPASWLSSHPPPPCLVHVAAFFTSSTYSPFFLLFRPSYRSFPSYHTATYWGNHQKTVASTVIPSRSY